MPMISEHNSGPNRHPSGWNPRAFITCGILLLLAFAACSQKERVEIPIRGTEFYPASKPWTRWWWFAGDVDSSGVREQLAWLRSNEFGGVEIAWVYPRGGREDIMRQKWQSPEWSAIVAYAARCADSLGLGCDFTFGTLWPFGDSMVPPEDGAITRDARESPTDMRLTWEHPVRGRVIDHLRRGSLDRYAERLLSALGPAMAGKHRALFCDSWEVETDRIWTPGFDTTFARAYGYDINPYMDQLRREGNEQVFYDYMKLVSEHVLRSFYERFTSIAGQHGAFTRVQCCGSPTDLLRAYASVDVPETEAILYEPAFARIPASAAAVNGKPIVSSETFTCLYGWKGWPGPGPHQGHEQVADLKLLADALFASGVNHIIWHGTPYNAPGSDNRFYASVHVGRGGSLAPHLRQFNSYMAAISREMRKGRVYSDVAVYLPLEDAWMGVDLPDSLKFPWAWGQYELRYQRTPPSLAGRQPLWVNARTLRNGSVKEGRLITGDCSFRAVFVDARYLDLSTVRALQSIAEKGVPICMRRRPEQPGRFRHEGYDAAVDELFSQPSVSGSTADLFSDPPLLDGNDLPLFWCREAEDGLRIFFAHPLAAHLKYPLPYGIAEDAGRTVRTATLRWGNIRKILTLRFPTQGSLLLHIDRNGRVREIQPGWLPKAPSAVR